MHVVRLEKSVCTVCHFNTTARYFFIIQAINEYDEMKFISALTAMQSVDTSRIVTNIGWFTKSYFLKGKITRNDTNLILLSTVTCHYVEQIY